MHASDSRKAFRSSNTLPHASFSAAEAPVLARAYPLPSVPADVALRPSLTSPFRMAAAHAGFVALVASPDIRWASWCHCRSLPPLDQTLLLTLCQAYSPSRVRLPHACIPRVTSSVVAAELLPLGYSFHCLLHSEHSRPIGIQPHPSSDFIPLPFCG